MPSEKNIDPEQFPDVERQDWNAETIAEESANKSSDEIVQEMARGGKSEADADKHDVPGSVKFNDTPRGREETKKK